jgi:hypothetical protein
VDDIIFNTDISEEELISEDNLYKSTEADDDLIFPDEKSSSDDALFDILKEDSDLSELLDVQ